MLENIFKNNPELLQSDEVQALLKHVQEQHSRNFEIAKRYKDFYDTVSDKCMYSELILIEGKSSYETLKEILYLIEEF